MLSPVPSTKVDRQTGGGLFSVYVCVWFLPIHATHTQLHICSPCAGCVTGAVCLVVMVHTQPHAEQLDLGADPFTLPFQSKKCL